MSEEKFDVCVIGAGPGGYVAAIRAAQRGLDTALVEKGPLGGTCLNIGCIPTKTLIASGEVLHSAKSAAEFGIKITGKIEPEWKKLQERKDSIVDKLQKGIASLLKAAGVTLFKGEASFKDSKTISVGKEKISAANFIIATGSEPLIPGFIPESDRILSSTGLLSIGKIPKSLLVLGGGVIGCEFACLFNRMGSEVTVVEMLDSILPPVDREVSALLSREMKKAGINVLTGTPLENVKASKDSVSGTVNDKKLSAEYMLVSIGRKPSSSKINLNAAGVKADEKGWIPVDAKCKTKVPGIYAIGDITGKWQLAHAASAMGLCVIDNICGKRSEFDGSLVPGCIFTAPEIGAVGMTEEECKEKKIDCKVGKFPFAALGKSMAINETSGFCKIISDASTDQVLGVHIIGPHATDLIAETTTAMNLEITAGELGKAIHAHPTLGEVTMEAAHAVHGESIHVPVQKKKKS